MRSILLAAVAAASLLVAGCTTPAVPIFGGSPGRSAGAKGGDAEGDTLATKTNLAFAQPGGDARVVPVENSDQVTSTQAAPAFTLNLVADIGAAIAGDPLVQSYARGLAGAQERLNAAKDPAEIEAAQGWVKSEREALAARIDKMRSEYAPGSAASISSLYFQPVVIMSNAEDVQRLDANTAREGARGLLAAVLAGLDEDTAKLVAQALQAPAIAEPAEKPAE